MPILEDSIKMLPWGAESIEEFLFYCCPECDEKYKDCQNFIDHAMHAHDSAEVSTLESSNIETEEIIQEESKDEDDCMDPLSFEIDIVEEMKQELQEEVESLIIKDNKLDTQEGLECDSNEAENEADDAHSEEKSQPHEKQMSKNETLPGSIARKRKRNKDPLEENDSTEVKKFKWDGKLHPGKKCMDCSKIVHPGAYARHVKICFKNMQEKKERKEKKEEAKKHKVMTKEKLQADKKVKCEFCEAKLSNGSLQKHVNRFHPEERKIKCDKCDFISKSKCEFKSHYHTHDFTKLANGKFQCNFCDIQLEPHRPLSSHNHFYCDLCSYTCSNKNALDRHKHVMHSIDISFRFLCEKCDFKAMTKGDLKRHQEKVHEGKTEMCFICGKDVKSLYSHMKHEHGDGPDKVNCDICHESIKATQLQAHKNRKHQHFICTLCNKFFEYKQNLYSHYSKEHQVFCIKGERFACHICKKTQETMDELISHLKEDHQIKDEHPCFKCELPFPTKTLLAIHLMNLHGHKEKDAAIMLGTIKVVGENKIDNRKFSCEICLRKFSSEKSLSGHKKQFHEKHDFKCDQCDFTTYENYRLKFHKMHKHEKGTRFPCDQCSYASNFRATLDRHVKEQHEKRFDHSCTVCGKEFMKKSVMAKHMLHKHDIVIDYQNRFAPVSVK